MKKFLMLLAVSVAMMFTIGSVEAKADGVTYYLYVDADNGDVMVKEDNVIYCTSDPSADLSAYKYTTAQADPEKMYKTLYAALLSISESETAVITVMSDITLGGDNIPAMYQIPNGEQNKIRVKNKNITLDLNGHTVTGVYTSIITVYGGTLTIEGTSGKLTGFGPGGESDDWSSIYIADGGKCFLKGNCELTNSGRVYVASDSEFSMISGKISSCTSYSVGGAVEVEGTFNMSGGTISECSATYGAGVFLDGGTFNMSGGTIYKCGDAATQDGGAVYVAGGTFTMTDGEIKECTAKNGGGVYLSGGTFSMNGESTISSCDADANGGGIYNKGVMYISGGSITGCNALEDGAGAGIYNDGVLNIGGGKIVVKGNYSNGNRSNVITNYNATSYLNIVGNLTEGSRIGAIINLAGTTYENVVLAKTNGSYTGVGNIYSEYSDLVATAGNTGELKWTAAAAKIGSEKYASVAAALADANAVTTGAVTIVLNADSTEADQLEISNDSQVITLDLNGHTLTGPGGGKHVIHINNNCMFTLKDSSVQGTGKVVQPAASAEGTNTTVAAIKNGDTSIFKMTGGTIDSYTDGVYHQGGVHMSGSYSKFEMSGGTIYSSKGVGVFVSCSMLGDFTMKGGTITSGGNSGVYLDSGTFSFSGGTIKDCTSDSGAGIYANSCSEVYMSGTAGISNCRATDITGAGGGVRIVGTSIFIMSGGSISNCHATGANSNGGGVYVDSAGHDSKPAFSMSGTASITECTASKNGGGVYVSSTAKFKVKGNVVIKDNKKGTANNNVYLDSLGSDKAQIILEADLGESATIGVSQAGVASVTTDHSVVFGVTGSYSGAEKFFFDNNPKIVGYADTFYNELSWELPRIIQDQAGNKYYSVKHAFDNYATTVKLLGDSIETDKISLSGRGSEGTPLVLDLNGHTITGTGNTTVFDLYNSYLKITDSSADKAGKITMPANSNNSNNGGGLSVDGGSLTLEAGTITGCVGSYAGGIYLSNSKLYMTGGKITDCVTKEPAGGAIRIDGSSEIYFSGDATVTGNVDSAGKPDNVFCYGTEVFQNGNLTGSIGIKSVDVTAEHPVFARISPATATYTGTDNFFYDLDDSYIGRLRTDDPADSDEIEMVKTCTVTFNMNGHGTAPANQKVWPGEKAAAPAPDPSASGYRFDGWYKESSFANAFDFANEIITGDTTIYAKWTSTYTAPTYPVYEEPISDTDRKEDSTDKKDDSKDTETDKIAEIVKAAEKQVKELFEGVKTYTVPTDNTIDEPVAAVYKDGVYVDKDNKPITNSFVVSNDKIRFVGENGKSVKKTLLTVVNVETGKVTQYYATKNGIIANCKLITLKDGSRVYATEDGSLATSCIVTAKSTGRQYYVDKNGKVKKNSVVKVEGKKYYCNKYGVIRKNALVTDKNGRKHYCTADGSFATSKWVTVGKYRYWCSKYGNVTKKKAVE